MLGVVAQTNLPLSAFRQVKDFPEIFVVAPGLVQIPPAVAVFVAAEAIPTEKLDRMAIAEKIAILFFITILNYLSKV